MIEKKSAPAALRNREPIADVLAEELPSSGTVLEIASGTGEHAAFFATRFPHLEWQPTDPDPEALASIEAWRGEADLPNLRAPAALDAASPEWPIEGADAMLCINMIHISPWEASKGLFAGAARLLPQGGKLLLYGPYLEDEVETAQSNLDFDAWLKARDPRFGLRNIADVDTLAARNGLSRSRRAEMPANNLTLAYLKL
jgi:cyclopropane fatty-acyl-phospholipid synthase-like methyltransferase